jgi:hypothetical protein
MAASTTGPAGGLGGTDLHTLSPQECFGLLETGGVGRVGLMTATGIVILPVNFALAGKTIIFRTAPDTLLAAYDEAPVSFEADRLDEAHREGWSVLVHAAHLEPWADGARDVYVRITPARISGRCIERTG